MKHLYAIITSVAGMLTLATSCSVNEMDTYENDPAIYFDHETADSVAYSFFTLDSHIPRDTVWVETITMGLPSDQDRPFTIVQTNTSESDAAQPGVHYIPFDDPEVRDSIRISAGEVTRLVPVILLRGRPLLSRSVAAAGLRTCSLLRRLAGLCRRLALGRYFRGLQVIVLPKGLCAAIGMVLFITRFLS